MNTPMWAIILYVVVSIFSALATFFLKLAAPKIKLSFNSIIKNWQLILGVFLYGIATLFSLIALKAGELSVLYPFVALQYIWANFLSKKYLGENIGFLKWAGIFLIFIGVGLIGLSS